MICDQSHQGEEVDHPTCYAEATELSTRSGADVNRVCYGCGVVADTGQ